MLPQYPGAVSMAVAHWSASPTEPRVFVCFCDFFFFVLKLVKCSWVWWQVPNSSGSLAEVGRTYSRPAWPAQREPVFKKEKKSDMWTRKKKHKLYRPLPKGHSLLSLLQLVF